MYIAKGKGSKAKRDKGHIMKNFNKATKIVNTFTTWDHNNTYPITEIKVSEDTINITIANHTYTVSTANELIEKVVKQQEPKAQEVIFSYNFS